MVDSSCLTLTGIDVVSMHYASTSVGGSSAREEEMATGDNL